MAKNIQKYPKIILVIEGSPTGPVVTFAPDPDFEGDSPDLTEEQILAMDILEMIEDRAQISGGQAYAQ